MFDHADGIQDLPQMAINSCRCRRKPSGCNCHCKIVKRTKKHEVLKKRVDSNKIDAVLEAKTASNMVYDHTLLSLFFDFLCIDSTKLMQFRKPKQHQIWSMTTHFSPCFLTSYALTIEFFRNHTGECLVYQAGLFIKQLTMCSK